MPLSLSLPAAPRERGWTRQQRLLRQDPQGCPARAGMDPGSSSRRPWLSRLPRASGDGPGALTAFVATDMAAPRERGWTLAPLRGRSMLAGCPARAGMDPCCACGCVRSSRLPRASGDGPHSAPQLLSGTKAAPRERGWTPEYPGRSISVRGCPARAGMDPGWVISPILAARLPRASGDGPVMSAARILNSVAAPRERGWTLGPETDLAVIVGCPARAGMDP